MRLMDMGTREGSSAPSRDREVSVRHGLEVRVQPEAQGR
jgi:hypothetical protein